MIKQESNLETVRNIVLKNINKDNYAVFLYGSHANGKHKENSDIDVGILGEKPVDAKSWNTIVDEIENANFPDKVDVVDFYKKDEEFKKFALSNVKIWNNPYHLASLISEANDFVFEPIELYHRRYNAYKKALLSFKKLMDIDLKLFENNTIVDGLKNGQAQKFEICGELTWKTIKRFMQHKHDKIQINSPKSAFEQFHKSGYINKMLLDDLNQLWKDRNTLTHEYMEHYFEEVCDRFPKHLHNMIKVSEIIELTK